MSYEVIQVSLRQRFRIGRLWICNFFQNFYIFERKVDLKDILGIKHMNTSLSLWIACEKDNSCSNRSSVDSSSIQLLSQWLNFNHSCALWNTKTELMYPVQSCNLKIGHILFGLVQIFLGRTRELKFWFLNAGRINIFFGFVSWPGKARLLWFLNGAWLDRTGGPKNRL